MRLRIYIKSLNETFLIMIIAIVIILLVVWFNGEKVQDARKDLCRSIDFTKPLEQEIKYNEEISQDNFIKYLRRSIDDFVDKKYEIGGDCTYPGLYKGVHCEDSAYNSETGPVLFTEYPSVLKGKIIVLQTDTAPVGGMSVIFLFKNKPNELYYAWVFGEKNGYYDLRGLYVYSAKEDEPSISEIQQMAINQICDEQMGI